MTASTKKAALPQTYSKSVPLAELRAGDAINARRTGRDASLEELKASILAHGVVQSLRVRLVGQSHYQVIAGNRRLLALQSLLADGKIKSDYQVPVIAGIMDDDGAAHELSIVENLERVPVSPIDEIKAYGRLLADGLDSKAIALRFGVPAKRVQQRLKLADLHPELMALLEQEKLSFDTAQAFTMAEPARQLEVFKSVQKANNGYVNAWVVKRELTKPYIAADSELARFIGKEAYTSAGGEVIADLFEDGSYWTSRDVVNGLVEAKWADQIAAWLAEGWGWVKSVDEVPNYYERTRLAKVDDAYPAEGRDAFGVVYWPTSGRAELGIGAPKPTAAAAPKVALPPEDPAAVGPTVSEELSSVLSDSIRTEVAADPELALPLLAAFMSVSQCGKSLPGHLNFGVAGGGLVDGKQTIAESFAYFDAMPDEELLAAIARMFANTLDVRDTFLDPKYRYTSTSLADRQKVVADLVAVVVPRDFPEFDAVAYFAAVKKPLIAAAFKEITGEVIKDGKKAEMAATTAKLAIENGWLPIILRSAAYEGPGAAGAVQQLEAAE